ncbi:uncharacterized protein F5891DRAFT_300230 [Suillus fuscotomentosus]|uniref:Uncharacterized protein n=1 Tax=Suillus fuscotomentosus TaxID=1912939 RepID=A0AAD4E8Z4_9AGAM|nr:uncharacterized protein F5891DRAFT_300230 [Suillus fuscotomentosus]KAG1900604.1 hypothetical protein F5891DRAFT_300230 [Suillus fuscotomentosus]
MTAVLRSPTQSPVLTVTSSRASNSSCSHMHNASVPMRHIRFAPLPEPTAQVDNSNSIMDSHPRALSSLSSDIVDVQRNTSSKSKPKSSLSRQFNLFKRSSTDSTAHDPQPYDFGAPLSRSASIPILSNDNQPRYFSTAPSTNSLCSAGDHHAMPKNHFPSHSPSPSSSPSSFPPTSPSTRPKVTTSGMHMLNGRIYGSKRRPLTNLFANVRDEPDFVEWGYGGMGSISSSSDSKYSALAKGTPALLSDGHSQKVSDGAGVSYLAGGDSDDGSGMEWVRRRRQRREGLAARGNTC